LANGFEIALYFGDVFFPIGEAGIGNGTEVIDAFGQGGLDVFVVFELVGEVFEGIAWFIRFGGDAGELLDCFPKFLDGFIDEGLDFSRLEVISRAFSAVSWAWRGRVSRGIRQRRGMNFIGNSYMDWQEKGKGIFSRKAPTLVGAAERVVRPRWQFELSGRGKASITIHSFGP